MNYTIAFIKRVSGEIDKKSGYRQMLAMGYLVARADAVHIGQYDIHNVNTRSSSYATDE